ncbi:sigma-70 family RNA polymerase sigma factor [Prosthecobacter sp. SYSU 5D2]|uniref:sigma-70 family RNA polymerase sigma factor n=1 Tax=Prosthecobacter sp. SYSU 5D2 TaxID=3134134 RepID=UPI0031FE666F
MTSLEISDETLVQQVGQGDVRSFEKLYDRFSPRLFGLLRQMLEDEKEAEDVLQEGFLYLWDHASSYNPDRSRAFTWTVMIFRHKAIDRMRALGRRARVMESAACELAVLEPTAVTAGETVDMKERQKRVHTALNELPGEQRKLIEFAFLKGLTHHAIAESLNLPLGTVKTNIRRGLLRLRDLMKGGQS